MGKHPTRKDRRTDTTTFRQREPRRAPRRLRTDAAIIAQALTEGGIR